MDVRRRWLIGAATGLIAACGALVWLSLQEPHGEVRRLPGGLSAELLGSTYGKHHRLDRRSGWQRAADWWTQLAPALKVPPSGSQYTFVIPASDGVHERETPSDQCVFWLRLRKQTSGRQTFQPVTGATIDSHGCRVLCGRAEWINWIGWLAADNTIPEVFSVPLEAYPRREPTFRLLFADWNNPGQPADYLVANPRPVATQLWQAHRCPVEARSGNLRVVLRSLRHAPSPALFLRSNAALDCYEDGKLSRNWRVNRVAVNDATGNALSTDYSDGVPISKVEFNALCRFESAWKLRFVLVRAHPEVAPDVHLWRIPVRAFPRRDTYVPLTSSLSGPGFFIKGVRVSGGGTVRFKGGTETGNSPVLTLTGSAKDEVSRLSLIRVADAGGREYPMTFPHSQTLPTGGAEDRLDLPAVPAGKPVTLTLAIERPRTVELLVKP